MRAPEEREIRLGEFGDRRPPRGGSKDEFPVNGPREGDVRMPPADGTVGAEPDDAESKLV